MTKQTREKWQERIRQWRASGKTAADFVADKDFQAASLRWAVSQLDGADDVRLSTAPSARPAARRGAVRASTPATGPLKAPAFLPVRVRPSHPPSSGDEMIVEVDGARIRVGRGADMALLGDVLRALRGGAR